jgi:hypothetical protein
MGQRRGQASSSVIYTGFRNLRIHKTQHSTQAVFGLRKKKEDTPQEAVGQFDKERVAPATGVCKFTAAGT